VVLGFVGFIEGYDLALTGSLLVLAKEPLHLSPDQIRALAVWPTFVVLLGGFTAASMSDRISRLAVMQIGVIVSTLCTLLIMLARNYEQLLILRLITGFWAARLWAISRHSLRGCPKQSDGPAVARLVRH